MENMDILLAKRILFKILLLAAFTISYQQDQKSWSNNNYPIKIVNQDTSKISAVNENVLSARVDESVEQFQNDDNPNPDQDYGEEYDEDSANFEASDEQRNGKENGNESAGGGREYEEEEAEDDDGDYYIEYENVTDSQSSGINNSSTEIESERLNDGNDKENNIDLFKNLMNNSSKDSINDSILIGAAIVSVVTTKSVVNGTISFPTSFPMTTEQMDSPPINPSLTTANPHLGSTFPPTELVTIDDSRIIASVQTSRSISGARFLPFNFQNDDSRRKTTEKIINEEGNSNKTVSESTESIIDKLDRVQSELSSGFLTSGFRNPGNSLKLDVLNDRTAASNSNILTTRQYISTTGKIPVISKFVGRQKVEKKETNVNKTVSNDSLMNEQPKVSIKIPWPGLQRPRTTTESNKQSKSNVKPVKIVKDITSFLPNGYKINDNERTTENSILKDILSKAKINISSFLPSNYKLKEEMNDGGVESSKESGIQSLFTKSSVDINAFLPPDYEKKVKPSETKTETSPAVKQKDLTDLFSKSSVDISAFLPAGFTTEASTTETVEVINSTAKPNGGLKIVFPSRPGGRKAISKAVGQPNREISVTAAPKIQKGWPTRATTEFTGWPSSSSTTPISIEKLLEAAKTATATSHNISTTEISPKIMTTSTTTTTTTTVRPTTPGVCQIECEVAGTIKIVGNATWVPELFDRNTREWQVLANQVENEINSIFNESAILRKWYKKVRIDAFSPGSILVDYFIELQDLTQRINTQEIKVLFHDSLRTYNAHRWNETTKIRSQLRLGEFLIDPKSTDFVIIPKSAIPRFIEKDDRLIPQWAVAVIVIGIGGLIFIIIFGVSVLINRENASKLKPSVSGLYGEDAAKNIMHSSSLQELPKSEISTIWNEADNWRDKSHKILVDRMMPDEKDYNIYDSWKSEWNGYSPSHTSSKFAGYESTSGFSRYPPDYDPNF